MFQSLPHSPQPMMDQKNQGRRPLMLRALQLLKVGPSYSHHSPLPTAYANLALSFPSQHHTTHYSCGASAHCVPPSRLYSQLPSLLAEMRLLSAGQWELGPASMRGSTVCTLSIILPWNVPCLEKLACVAQRGSHTAQ